MSRIGKKSIAVPSGVTVTLDGQAIRVKGPKGELSHTLPEEISIGQADGQLTLTPTGDSQRHNAMWGLSRTLTNNMVEGVTKGYEEVLELVGVGYRAALKGRDGVALRNGVRCDEPVGQADRHADAGGALGG